MSYTKQRIQIRADEVYGLFRSTFAPIDALALGAGLAVATSLLLVSVIIGAIVSGDADLTQAIELLGQYFYGVNVSFVGALWGVVGGAILGLFFGVVFATLRNAAVAVLLGVLRLTSYSFALSEDIND